MNECMNAWMHECMNAWMNEWMNVWIIRWMNIDEKGKYKNDLNPDWIIRKEIKEA
jgi:hypothetical protein